MINGVEYMVSVQTFNSPAPPGITLMCNKKDIEGTVRVFGVYEEKTDDKSVTVYTFMEKMFKSVAHPDVIKNFKKKGLLLQTRFITQVAEALINLHEEGIVFGNLNLDNIMATDETLKTYKLVDFAYAQKINEPYSN